MNAHDREYAAAVAGMAETYGTRTPRTYADGDYVSGISCGKPWSGRIDWFHDNGDACIDVGGAWLSVPVRDITF
jgi:hypothetical protein